MLTVGYYFYQPVGKSAEGAVLPKTYIGSISSHSEEWSYLLERCLIFSMISLSV